MKIYKVHFNKSGVQDLVTTQPPEFVPGYVVFTLNDRKVVAVPQSDSNLLEGFSWSYIDKRNPNYHILKAKVSKDK